MTSFAPDSIVLNRKLPLWYQVSQSLRASILGRSAAGPAAAAHRGAAGGALRGERADHAAGAQGAGGRGADHPASQARHVHRAERAAGRAGAAARLGRRDRGPAVGHDDRAAGPRHGAGVRRELAEYFPDLAEVATYHRLRSDEKTGEPTNHARNYVRPELAAADRPGGPGALAHDQGAARCRGRRASAGSPTPWRPGSRTRRRRGCSKSRCSARSCTTRASSTTRTAAPLDVARHPLPRRPLLLHGHPRRPLTTSYDADVTHVVRCRA